MAFGGKQEDADALVFWHLGTNEYTYNEDDDAYNEELSFLYRVQSEAKSKIARFESFMKGLLPGMSEHAGPNCHLRMLGKGMETSVALKKSIASYLGVPARKDLPMFQKTVDNLSNLPSFRHICNCSFCNHRYDDD